MVSEQCGLQVVSFEQAITVFLQRNQCPKEINIHQLTDSQLAPIMIHFLQLWFQLQHTTFASLILLIVSSENDLTKIEVLYVQHMIFNDLLQCKHYSKQHNDHSGLEVKHSRLTASDSFENTQKK